MKCAAQQRLPGLNRDKRLIAELNVQDRLIVQSHMEFNFRLIAGQPLFQEHCLSGSYPFGA